MQEADGHEDGGDGDEERSLGGVRQTGHPAAERDGDGHHRDHGDRVGAGAQVQLPDDVEHGDGDGADDGAGPGRTSCRRACSGV